MTDEIDEDASELIEHRFTVGDVIKLADWHVKNGEDAALRRQIVELSPTGYDWKYPEFGETTPSGHRNVFASEMSSDPALDAWVLA